MYFLVIITIILILLRIYTLLCPSLWVWWQGNKIPGPPALPVIGNGLLFLQSKSRIQTFKDLIQRYGNVLRLWLGKELVVVITNPEDAKTVLLSKKCLNKSFMYNLTEAFLGNGLITATEDIWHVHRKKLAPTFNNKMLKNYMGIMQSNAEILCDQLKHKVNSSEFDILEYFEKCALDIICEAAMGIKLHTQNFQNVYCTSLHNLNEALTQRWLHPWLYPDLIFRRTACGKMYYESLSTIKREVSKVIRERKRILSETVTSTENEEMNSDYDKKNMPFLDYVLLESGFDDDEIEDEVQTFLFAGHETSTLTMYFCIYLLSKNQHIQDKLVKEILDVLPRSEPTINDYINMKYLDLVIKESLRLYSVAPLTGRMVKEALTLPSGYTIPAGSTALLYFVGMHQDEKLFPHPESFVPERFEDKNCEIHPYAWAAFSKGDRNCVGQKLAMLELKIILSALLLRYKFLLADLGTSLTVDMQPTVRPTENILVKIVPRNLTIDE